MSMAGQLLDETKQDKIFGRILKREENQFCADCQLKAPTWVSLDFGIFLCMACSGAHRHLSRKVTRVYSTKIDRWNNENVEIMDYVGNAIANSYWEFKQPKRIATNCQPEDRIRFVNEKYIKKIYSDPKGCNPVQVFLENRSKGILEKPVQKQDKSANNPTLQVINDNKGKELQFYSNSGADNQHIAQLKQQTQIQKSNFNSFAPTKNNNNIVDLLDFDDNVQNNNQDLQFSDFIQGPSNQNGQNQNNQYDLMNLYNNNQNGHNTQKQQANSNNLDLFSIQEQEKKQNNNQITVDKNKYQAFNQLGQYNQYNNPYGQMYQQQYNYYYQNYNNGYNMYNIQGQ